MLLFHSLACQHFVYVTETGSLLIAPALEMAEISANNLCQGTLLVLVVYGLREASSQAFGKAKGYKKPGRYFCCCLLSEPVVQPGVMFGQRDGHPLAAD